MHICGIPSMNKDELIKYIHSIINEKHNGYQCDFAASNNISAAYVNDVLFGRREPGQKILNIIGFKKVVMYEKKENVASKESFYIFVEDQHDEPCEILAFDPESAAIQWVTQFECDTAMEYGVATEGNEITCHIFDLPQYTNAKKSRKEFGHGWLDCSHSIFTVTGDYVPSYYAMSL